MKLISDSATRMIGRKILQVKQQSPHIFFGAGVAGVIGSTVLACRATLKLEETLDVVKEELDVVKNLHDSPRSAENEYTDQAYYRDLGYVYGRSAYALGKLYGVPVIVGSLSIAALTGAHVQLSRRNTALTATVSLLSTAMEEYRARVREEVGVDREYELFHHLAEEEIDGRKELVKVGDPAKLSMYAKFFDEASPEWRKDPELNRIFIQCQQNYHNHILQARGHVFLNEVYDALGIDRTGAGAVVGWVFNSEGDNYIDFGLFSPDSSRFVNNYERSILLDFNVDGVIADKI